MLITLCVKIKIFEYDIIENDGDILVTFSWQSLTYHNLTVQ